MIARRRIVNVSPIFQRALRGLPALRKTGF
jgi:hypothetical protein